jgi:putative transposase
VPGVSTRVVDDEVAAIGVDSGISKPEMSRICASLMRGSVLRLLS